MNLKTVFYWKNVEEDGLPIINEKNTSVLFIFDGIIIEGWPAIDDYYKDMGLEIPDNNERLWESADGSGEYDHIKYYAYIPKTMGNFV
jgi:hypothetical protein